LLVATIQQCLKVLEAALEQFRSIAADLGRVVNSEV
jgi:hypothetical protein